MDFIVHRIFMIYMNVAVIFGAYYIPQKYVEALNKRYVVDLFQKAYISIIGLAIIFILSIAFASKYDFEQNYLISQCIIFFLPFFVGIVRAFKKLGK